MLTEMYTKDNGFKIRHMDLELIHILMELNMLAIGRMINNMEKELKLGKMKQDIKDNIFKDGSKVKDFSNGEMILHIKDNLNKTILMVLELIYGVMGENILAIG